MIESLSRAAPIAALVAGIGCADEDFGRPIPGDQLYYPLGIRTLVDPEGRQRLAVLSTNFDQRFQSSQVTLLDADALVDGVLEGLGVPNGEDPCVSSRRPLFNAGFEVAGRQTWLSRVRVPGIGGELLSVPDGQGGHRLYMTDRLDSVLVMVEENGSVLNCARPGGRSFELSDCTDDFVTISEGEDPFSLAEGQGPDGQRFIAVGHLFSYVRAAVAIGVVTFFDEEALIARSQGNLVSAFMSGFELVEAGGISGVAFSPARPSAAGWMALPASSGPELRLASIELRDDGGNEDQVLTSAVGESVDLRDFGRAADGRGLAVSPDGRRAILSLRFDEPSISFSAGVGVVGLESDNLEAFPIREVGNELGPPSFRPQDPGEPLLAYFGDLRTDKVWIVDVTQNLPQVVGEILGRDLRTLPDGRVLDGRTLDGPTGLAFTRRGDRRFGFVTNFANSTLAVLDVTDPVPQRHCLIARLGRDVDADGESEVDRL